MLSIGIPTYNRENQLHNQLYSLFSQDLSGVDEIIVVDNKSEYNINALIDQFDKERCKIRLIENAFNIRMAVNMVSPLLYCKSEWLWLLSDDDQTSCNAVQDVLSEIKKSPANTGMIKFSVDGFKKKNNYALVTDLTEFIDYYYSEKELRRGELVFISNNVLNMNNLKPYLGYAFEYSYNYISFLIPVLMGLDNKHISVVFSEKPVVKYIPPRGNGYSFGVVGKGLSTFSHIPFSLNKKYKKRLYNLIMSISYFIAIKRFLLKEQVKDIYDIRLMYDNIYKYYLSYKDRLICKLLIQLLSIRLFRCIAFYIAKKNK